MLSGLKSNSSSVTRIASQTLIETGGNITRFRPQLVALLHDDVEKTKLSMLQNTEKIGVDAKPLVAAVEPLTKSSQAKYGTTQHAHETRSPIDLDTFTLAGTIGGGRERTKTQSLQN